MRSAPPGGTCGQTFPQDDAIHAGFRTHHLFGRDVRQAAAPSRNTRFLRRESSALGDSRSLDPKFSAGDSTGLTVA